MKLSAALDGFWLDKRREFSKTTVRNYSPWFRRFVTFVGDIEFTDITTTHVKRYLNHLADDKGYSKRSVSDRWAPLSSLWTWAEIELGTPHIIRGRVALPDYPDTLIEPFTQDEIRALLIAAEYSKPWETRKGKTARSRRTSADRDRAMRLVLLASGLRALELPAHLCNDVLAQRGNIAELQMIWGHAIVQMSLYYAKLAEVEHLQVVSVWYKKLREWWVKPIKKKSLNIVTDFTPYERPERIGKLGVPPCKLLISKDTKAFADTRYNANIWREMLNDLELLSP